MISLGGTKLGGVGGGMGVKPDVCSEGCRVALTSTSLRRKSFAFKHHTQIKFHWNLFWRADHILPFG